MKWRKHTPEHSLHVTECGICRIKTLERDAELENSFAALALYNIACEATRTLERLHIAKVKVVCELVAGIAEWPVMANVNVKDSQKVPAALGTHGAGVPISWKKLFTLNKVPHWILYRLFSIIGLLRTLHSERVVKSHIRRVGILPRKLNAQILTKFIESAPDALANVLAHRALKAGTPPEVDPENRASG